MEDPRSVIWVLATELQELGIATHAVDDHGFVQLLGYAYLLFKSTGLQIYRSGASTIEATLAYGHCLSSKATEPIVDRRCEAVPRVQPNGEWRGDLRSSAASVSDVENAQSVGGVGGVVRVAIVIHCKPKLIDAKVR